jgi:hypothetical protein
VDFEVAALCRIDLGKRGNSGMSPTQTSLRIIHATLVVTAPVAGLCHYFLHFAITFVGLVVQLPHARLIGDRNDLQILA